MQPNCFITFSVIIRLHQRLGNLRNLTVQCATRCLRRSPLQATPDRLPFMVYFSSMFFAVRCSFPHVDAYVVYIGILQDLRRNDTSCLHIKCHQMLEWQRSPTCLWPWKRFWFFSHAVKTTCYLSL
jgi:hypothetical protein